MTGQQRLMKFPYATCQTRYIAPRGTSDVRNP
jgi:hypothetical protein